MSNNQVNLGAGIAKQVYIDGPAIRRHKPAWKIRTADGAVTCAGFEVGGFRFVQSGEPLFFDGPNCWVETSRSIDFDDDVEHFAWPTPLVVAATETVDLGPDVLKRLHVDKRKIRRRRPAWTIRTDSGLVVSPSFTVGALKAVQSTIPLYDRGPFCWVETSGSIELPAEARTHQVVFQKDRPKKPGHDHAPRGG